MRVIAIALTGIALSGCMSSYEPKFATSLTDQAKYAEDFKFCQQEAKDRQLKTAYSPEGIGKGAVIGSFGLVGAAGVAATSDEADDYTKCPLTMVDECLTKKGYAVIKTEHHC